MLKIYQKLIEINDSDLEISENELKNIEKSLKDNEPEYSILTKLDNILLNTEG